MLAVPLADYSILASLGTPLCISPSNAACMRRRCPNSTTPPSRGPRCCHVECHKPHTNRRALTNFTNMLRYSPLVVIFVGALPVDASESFSFQGERPSHFACVFGLGICKNWERATPAVLVFFFSQFTLCPCATADCRTRATPFSCMVSSELEKDSLHRAAREAVCTPLSAITNTNMVMYPKCTAR